MAKVARPRSKSTQRRAARAAGPIADNVIEMIAARRRPREGNRCVEYFDLFLRAEALARLMEQLKSGAAVAADSVEATAKEAITGYDATLIAGGNLLRSWYSREVDAAGNVPWTYVFMSNIHTQMTKVINWRQFALNNVSPAAAAPADVIDLASFRRGVLAGRKTPSRQALPMSSRWTL